MFVRRKDAEREEARRLRREEGLSVRAIAARLSVSRSSASLWVREVPLTDQQQAALDAAGALGAAQQLGHVARSRRSREERLAAQEHGRTLAAAGDPLHQAGCMLFWAEGSRSRNHVRFTNSDAAMHRYFLRFLRDCYGVQSSAVSLTINCHLGHGQTLHEIERWWLEALDLPASSLRPSVLNRPSRASKGVRRPLLYGTAQLSVNSTRIAQSIYGAIQAYAGFERARWLDLDHASRPVYRPDEEAQG